MSEYLCGAGKRVMSALPKLFDALAYCRLDTDSHIAIEHRRKAVLEK